MAQLVVQFIRYVFPLHTCIFHYEMETTEMDLQIQFSYFIISDLLINSKIKSNTHDFIYD